MNYSEFVEQRQDFDAAVRATPDICDFCSSSSWAMAAHDGLHELSPDHNHHIYRDADAWLVMVEQRPRYWYPFEATWMFASPLIGSNPVEALNLLFKVAAEKQERNGYCLGGIRKGSEVHQLLHAHSSQMVQFEEFAATDCMTFDLSNGLEGFLEGRSRKFRKNLRATARKCEAAGLEIESLVNPDPVECFERILALQKTTHKWASGFDILQSEDCFRFYERLIRNMTEASQLRINFAQIDGEDVAFIFGGIFGKTYRGLQMSFNDQYRSLGLGNYLQFDNIKRVTEEGVQLYDLGMHSEYKEKWAEERREYVGVFLVL